MLVGVEVKVRCCREAKGGVRKGKCCWISHWVARLGAEFWGEVEAGRKDTLREWGKSAVGFSFK